MMKRSIAMTAAGLGVGAALFLAGAIGVTRSGSDEPGGPAGAAAAAAPSAVGDVVGVGAPGVPAGGSLATLIASLQTRLERVPEDHVSWATLGLAYVQEAKITVDPTYYGKADGALATSLEINDTDNYLAYAGKSALASARHDFAAARHFAETGLEINQYSAILHGTHSDALLQLGLYDEAFAAVQTMVDLSPDTASLSRASYTWELRGDLDQARRLMQRALDDAPTAADRAFALVHLGDMSFDAGDANQALELYLAALSAVPNDIAASAGKARAEAALGQVETALDDYAAVVNRAPEPGYIIEYGRLLESVGRVDEAERQYAVFAATQRLFAANGVVPDATETLFAVERGDIDRALADAEAAIRTRPFIAMHDARAWALHAAGRDAEALRAVDVALSLGTPSALFHFHAGMIALSLGDVDRARSELTMALEINPAFDPVYVGVARDTLASPELTA